MLTNYTLQTNTFIIFFEIIDINNTNIATNIKNKGFKLNIKFNKPKPGLLKTFSN